MTAPALRRRDARSSSARAAALTALFVAAQPAGLRLIDAPPYGVFQHLLPWPDAVASTPLALGVLALQTLVCLWVARPSRLFAEGCDVVRRLGPWRVLVAAGVVAFALVVPTESAGRFVGEWLLAAWIAASAALNLVLAVRAVPADALARLRARVTSVLTLERGASGPRRWDRRLPWLAAAWVAVCCSAIAWFVLEGVPHIDDGVAYLFQAKCLSAGALYAPAPPDHEAFAVTHLICGPERWFGKYFPGWPAVLALGVRVGAPWIVNPLLGAAGVVLAHELVRRTYDRALANVATLLLAASPWFLATSSAMMAHCLSLFCMLAALVAIDVQRERRAGLPSLVAGVALGLLFLTRPLDAALVGPIAGLWACGVAGRRLSFGSLVLVAASAAAVASLYFAYNHALTGDALLAPHRLWSDTLFGAGVDVLGFGPGVGIPLWRNSDPLPGHGLADVVLNANKNLSLAHFELFGWATGSLVLAVLAFVLTPRERGDALMAGLCGAVIVGHSCYWFPGGPDFGARFWYLTLVPLVVMSVRGARALAARLGGDQPGAVLGARIGLALLIATATALPCVMTWRCATKYHRYRDVGGDVRALAAEHDFSHALVFVRAPRRSDYQSAFSFGSPFLDGDGAVYARDLGPERRAALVRHFADRPVWVIGRPAEDDPRLVVLSGPFEPGTTPPGAAYEYDRALQAELR